MTSGAAAQQAGPHWTDERLTRRFDPKTTKALEKLGLETVGDLVRHYPRRYLQRGELTDLASLQDGEHVTVLARVQQVTTRAMRNRPGAMLTAVVTDGRGTLDLAFFAKHKGRLHYLEQKLAVGTEHLFIGQVGSYRGRRQLVHPEVEEEQAIPAGMTPEEYAAMPIPLYPATAALSSAKIRACQATVLGTIGEVPDPLPAEVLEEHGLLPLHRALEQLHRPRRREDVGPARRRFKHEEAFVLQAALARRRALTAALAATPRRPRDAGLLAEFDARLPFQLTAGQQAVGEEITHDLAADRPMHRLLQGEVGSGKTVVALRAMLAVVDAGGQAALLAPTEVLATQHHRSLRAMLGDLAEGGLLGGHEHGTRVAVLTGSQPAGVRRQMLLDVVSGDAGIVVGTHALLQEHVEFLDLGLVVVDEQHRFGVEQRDALRAKGRQAPHVLVMTATPIPRTVAMTVFGDLETSTLAELPRGRSPITTHVVPGDNEAWVERTWRRVREEVQAGNQAYVVCPRIGGDDPAEPDEVEAVAEDPEAQEREERRPAVAAVDVLELLQAHPALAGLRIDLLHGRLPADQKDAVMSAFAAGEVDVLVATTVVEVGVDVPNATAMVVMDADRFGVSQLHQLRGRVGRGDAAGLCLLVTGAPPGSPARERLDAVASTLDGFELARVDLEARREGDVLGASQSGGRTSLRMLRVLRDEDVIVRAREDATAVVAADPDLRDHPELARAIDQLLGEDREAFLERG